MFIFSALSLMVCIPSNYWSIKSVTILIWEWSLENKDRELEVFISQCQPLVHFSRRQTWETLCIKLGDSKMWCRALEWEVWTGVWHTRRIAKLWETGTSLSLVPSKPEDGRSPESADESAMPSSFLRRSIEQRRISHILSKPQRGSVDGRLVVREDSLIQENPGRKCFCCFFLLQQPDLTEKFRKTSLKSLLP